MPHTLTIMTLMMSGTPRSHRPRKTVIRTSATATYSVSPASAAVTLA